MHSKISVHLAGHLTADPRAFDLPRSGGAGCELRLTIARPDFDASGGRITRNRYVKVVTYDTRLAAAIYNDYSVGDFVEILADDVRSEKPWYSDRHKSWLSGGVTFALTKIRKVTALSPEAGQLDADGGVQAGVTAGTSAQPAGTETQAPAETAGARRPAGRRERRAQVRGEQAAEPALTA